MTSALVKYNGVILEDTIGIRESYGKHIAIDKIQFDTSRTILDVKIGRIRGKMNVVTFHFALNGL